MSVRKFEEWCGKCPKFITTTANPMCVYWDSCKNAYRAGQQSVIDEYCAKCAMTQVDADCAGLVDCDMFTIKREVQG